MSDEERSNLSGEEEVDDLFGDDAEEETTQTRPVTHSDDEDDSSSETETKSLKTSTLTLPRHPVSHKPEGDVFAIKIPVFLNVEAHPFDPTEFKERVARNAEERSKMEMDAKQMQNDVVAEKLLNENTIRWRYLNAGNDEIIKQSNAHFVEWDDGLVSLKVGNELFDFKSQPILDNFLARSYVEHEVLQNEAALTRSANLIPASTFTETHRRLTQAVKTIQKKDKILNTLTERDPMLKQRMADENERKNLKAKRQLEQKRRLQEERLGKSDSPAPRYGQESAYERFERAYGADEYDDEDDFVANDDEELEIDDEEAEAEEEEFERGAERLKNLKDEGASKYRDEEEVLRKRRRIIDSDDEE
ncbi:hypothetical protein C7M61_002640 [Candidozyma pseudohaemuli]|uniref:Leo1-like protein n=1 Tax=Candidozyma pseudohaemuli TaxID=418784 RepID=A0A2P7YRW8_9ASCO|nr:hypothetical protein C7M61_002640 [[Candida] pseudohaemulonii]PSK38701.1 hypothetical protein C7M61_002640 [[Candida] pseudohaemulonii]